MSLANYRPRTIGEIVDAAATLYRAHFATVVIVTMIIVVPPAIVKMFVPDWAGGIVDLIGNLLIPISQGAIAAVVAGAIERGEAMDVGQAFRSTRGRVGSLITVQIASGILVVLGMILLVIPGFIAIAVTAVCVPVVMIEQLDQTKAITRSRVLARGQWMRVLGTVALAWGVSFLIIIGASLIMGLVITNGVIVDLTGDIIIGLVLPVPAITTTLIYYDLRVRTESADLDAMISGLPPEAPTA
jgi:hypothetical protein